MAGHITKGTQWAASFITCHDPNLGSAKDKEAAEQQRIGGLYPWQKITRVRQAGCLTELPHDSNYFASQKI